jgi:energy-coupling factor transporter ATP-binding protein EcfA2
MADTVIGHDLETGEPVELRYDERPLGVTVIGRTGFGKSTLLEHLILADIARGTSAVVIDAHGDLATDVLTHMPPAAQERVSLIEVWHDRPFRLNLLAVPDPGGADAVDRIADGVVQVFKKLFGRPDEYYPRLEIDLGHALRTVIPNNGTLLDVADVFWDKDLRQQYLRNVTNSRTHQFWQNFDRLGRTDKQREHLESTINRLETFLASVIAQQILGSRETTVPFDTVLHEPGQVLLIRIPHGEIGEKLCNYLGSLLLCVLADRIYARSTIPPEEGPVAAPLQPSATNLPV